METAEQRFKLPPNYKYNLVEEDNLSAIIRIAEIKDEKSAMEWVEIYQNLSHIVWRVARTYKCTRKSVIFKKDFRCQHKTDKRSCQKHVRISKNTDCCATLRIVVESYYDEKLNPVCEEVKNFPCRITLVNTHNHSLENAAALRFQPLNDATKEELKRLFYCGHTVASAYRAFDLKMQLDHPEDYEKLVANSSIFPSRSIVRHLFDGEFKKIYGCKQGMNMILDLKALCQEYTDTTEGKAVIVQQEKEIAVAITTPIMLRAADLLPQAKELILVDASGHMDTLNHRIYFFIVPCVAGGVPVGCIITSAEKQSIFAAGKYICI